MAAEVVAAAVTAITDVEVMKASQIGMKAIAAAIAISGTGIAAAMGRDGDRFGSSWRNGGE